jgi:hypothetical protein
MDLERVERELKKRITYEYKWGRKQSNDWDSITNFIYKTYSFDSLLRKTEHLPNEMKNYALNRWYNYWSAMAIENIFASHNKVNPNKDIYDKLVDFTIDNIPFDHKTSIFPNGFNKSFTYGLEHKKELIDWLYINQSQEGRKHLKNRLFVVLCNKKDNQHWKLKSEISFMKLSIDDYVNSFDESKLITTYIENQKILSDIIWIERN